MPKKPSLAETMRQAVQGVEPPVPAAIPLAPPPAVAPEAHRPEAAPPSAGAFPAATRAGKKKVTAPLSPEDHKRLRRLALDRDATSEELLTEAIHDLFAKYGASGAGQGAGSR